MANRNAILLRPQWVVTNTLTLPLVTQGTGKNSIRGLIQFTIPITLFLDSLFDEQAGTFKKKRSLEDDQVQIFKSFETALATMGVDGKACLLRTICEMQKNPIGEMTIIGEILTVLLTPKRGVRDFLHEYLDAERVGQMENATISTCGTYYPKCPMSLFNLFKSYSTPADKPADTSYLYHEDEEAIPKLDENNEQDLSESASVRPKELKKQLDLENHYLMHV